MPTEFIQRITQFYRTCYQIENRELRLDQVLNESGNNYFQDKTKPQEFHFFSGQEQLARCITPTVELDTETGKSFCLQMSLYAHETQLIYGLFYICGYPPHARVLELLHLIHGFRDAEGRYVAPAWIQQANGDEKKKTQLYNQYRNQIEPYWVAGPLIYYEAIVGHNNVTDIYTLSIDAHMPVLNKGLLKRILREQYDASVLSTAPTPTPAEGITRSYLEKLSEWLKTYCYFTSSNHVDHVFGLTSGGTVTASVTPEPAPKISRKSKKKALRRKATGIAIRYMIHTASFPALEPNLQQRHLDNPDQENHLKIYSCGMLFYVKQKSISQNIRHELNELPKQAGFSNAIYNLLGMPAYYFDDSSYTLRQLYEYFVSRQEKHPNAPELFPIAQKIARRLLSRRLYLLEQIYINSLLSLHQKPSNKGEVQNRENLLFSIQHHNEQLFPTPAPTILQSRPHALPALLSQAQANALNNAIQYPLSIINGPPGTGKSYTLAAMALDRILNDETVLIVTGSEQAANVIADKLCTDMGLAEGVMNFGYNKTLVPALKDKLNFFTRIDLSAPEPNTAAPSTRSVENELKKCAQKELNLRKAFTEKGTLALHTSQLIVANEQKKLPWWKRTLQMSFVRRKISSSTKHWQILDQLIACQKQREILSRNYLNIKRHDTLQKLLNEHREEFLRYDESLNETEFKNWRIGHVEWHLMLKALPVWIMTFNDLHRVLPLHPNLFDLLIVDEATQCDIATALPAFSRCKRAVVTGDYQQLRHISFLSRQLEQHTFQKTGLPAETFEKWSYRDNSLLDLVNAQIKDGNAITFLDEHFRSRPELIAFSNQHFYNNRIKVMKERPVSPESMAEQPPALILERIEGARSSTNVNQAEVERTLELVQAHIHTYQNADTKPNIGILSPFRAQVDAIRQRLMREISADNILAFKILVGTPYGFQGEERDLMILSFTLDNESRRASYYLNRPDVFNVTVTRAREQQIVLFSGDENTLPPDNLLRLYLESIQSGYALQQPDATPHTEFQQQVCNALEIYGISIWKNFFIAGQVVDLICQKGERMLAIDLIGYPGPGEDYLGVERYQILARAGLEMLPLSYGVWTVDRQAAIDAILKRLA